MGNSRNNSRAVLAGLGASALLTALVIVGSRNLEHYDAALFGYTVASVVAFGAVVYRYALWLRRPATRVYWRRSWPFTYARSTCVSSLPSSTRPGGPSLSLARSRARLGRAGAASPMRAARDQESATAFYQSRAGRERPPDCGVRNMLKI